MGSVNRATILGNLGRDPEIRYLNNGDAVCSLNIATTEGFKDSHGERKERTEWHRAVLFRNQAELAAKYLKKGSTVYIEGRLQTRKWQDKDGIERYTTEIIADRMTFVGGSRQQDGNHDDDQYDERLNDRPQGPSSRTHYAANNQRENGNRNTPPNTNDNDMNDPYFDDIPF